MDSGLTYICGLAAMFFLTTSLALAAVRWFHMCRPFDRNPRYYYPGRPFVFAVFLNSALLIPYIINPECPDAWYLARIYFLPVTLFHFTVLMFAYFGSIMQWKKWRMPIIVMGAPVLAALVIAFCLAVYHGKHIEEVLGSLLCDYILYALGAVVTLFCFAALFMVIRWAKRFGEDDFSNSADFPVVAAKRWMLLVIVNVAFCWIGAVSDSRTVLAVLMVLLAIAQVVFIISALHPHRRGLIDDEEDGEDEKDAGVDKDAGAEDLEDAGSLGVESQGPCAEHIYSRTISQQKKGEILEAIRTVVEEQEAYLDPHLTLQDVADRSGYNRTYVSGLIKSEYGSFFSYINRRRLAHVESYQKENPAATILEAVIASGFNSRQAYYSVKKRLESNS